MSVYKQVSESAFKMPNWEKLAPNEPCQIVEINGQAATLKHKNFKTFSQGPFIDVIFKSYGQTVAGSHGVTPRAVVIKDGQEMTQYDVDGRASFFFVVKGGDELPQNAFSGGRKSYRRKSNKNKRTRRKSMKKHHHRRK